MLAQSVTIIGFMCYYAFKSKVREKYLRISNIDIRKQNIWLAGRKNVFRRSCN